MGDTYGIIGARARELNPTKKNKNKRKFDLVEVPSRRSWKGVSYRPSKIVENK